MIQMSQAIAQLAQAQLASQSSGLLNVPNHTYQLSSTLMEANHYDNFNENEEVETGEYRVYNNKTSIEIFDIFHLCF